VVYAGQSIKRFEDPRLLTGQGAFLDDLQFPSMLHATVLRSPHAHARLLSIETAAARDLPGVVAVITAEDLEGMVEPVPTRQETEAETLHPPVHPVLARGKVCYVGQPVAIVVAEDPYLARDARELIRVDYTPLPPVIDPLAAVQADTPIVHQELGTNIALRTLNAGGDIEAALRQAEHVVRQRYRVQRLAPAPLETRGIVASYEPQDNMLTVWDSTQHPHTIRDHLATVLHRPANSVRVVAPDVGGGFGEKGGLYPEEIAVPYLAMRLGRPVKWVEERLENLLAYHGRGHTVDVEAAVQRDGTLLGLRVQMVADLGAYFLMSTPTVPLLASHRLAGPYTTPAMHVEVLGVITNKPPTGAYRGAGGPEAAFCLERTIDLIARDLQLDPAAVRRKNFIPPEAFPYETPTGLTYDSGAYAKALDRALELSDYYRWRTQSQQPTSPGAPLMGVGLATVVKGSGGRVPPLTDHARVLIEPSGHITVHTGVSPHGQGSATTFAQVVADVLGVTPADVQVLHSDTAILPAGGGTAASRGLVAGGSALYAMLQEARQKLGLIASHLLDCPVADVHFQGQQVFSQHHPEQHVAFARLAAAAYEAELLPPGVEPGLDFRGSHTIRYSPYAFGAHVAVLEVSQETGAVSVLQYVAVHDAGRILNPLLAAGQVHGALAQGIGQALLEGMVYSPEGQPVTGSFLDYALPRASNTPAFILDTLETPSPLNPLGVKGIGELPTLAAPVAIANAVMDALSRVGVRHLDTPLTPERIWQALQAQGKSAS
jgi:aerobic carbon-monoxide dehydrogenase large subunit